MRAIGNTYKYVLTRLAATHHLLDCPWTTIWPREPEEDDISHNLSSSDA